MPTASPPDRKQILQPYLDKLAALSRHADEPTAPTRVNIGEQSFQIDPWERRAVLATLENGADGDWHDLLAQAVALRAKTLAAADRLPADDPDSAAELHRELGLDAAIGFALMDELQREVDRMVIEGERDLARRLTHFRNKLAHDVATLKEVIGEEALDDAEALAREMVPALDLQHVGANVDRAGAAGTEGGGSTAEIQALVALEEQLLRQHRDHRRERKHPSLNYQARPTIAVRPPVRSRSRVVPLLAALAVLVGVWLTFTVRTAVTRVELPVVTLADFSAHAEIQRVDARPPSLFVTVERQTWNGLHEDARRRLIQAVGDRIARDGYSGALVRDADGRTLGQWLRQGGVRLIDAGP